MYLTARRRRPVLTAALLSASAAIGLNLAAPAAADATAYLEEMQPRYAYLSSDQLLSAGRTACSMITSGEPAPSAVDNLAEDLGLGVPVAFDVVRAAVVHLDC
ncbi:Protein of unknown function (DUF732) [Mycolicibacterium chubuense NBB4]|uniref:DUF732 domain-containing protein n=1 Tax=Mycolicibacterium chubuense (strain NBB4) TaxID=710421 RepID=I4BLA2_MYCCN|nr:DUF732 domain-containing protein [Mycolicibacterium chubuense]AFM18059.1 Protein of unknown function (DUF732) [Mycolicibacterium chubuense NBB4]